MFLHFNSHRAGYFLMLKPAVWKLFTMERTATNGDVRMFATPEQWDGMGQLVSRKVDEQAKTITTQLSYPELGFNYSVVVRGRPGVYPSACI